MVNNIEAVSEHHFPASKNIRRYDGSIWRTFEFHDGGELILTARGLELIWANNPLRHLLKDYQEDAAKNLDPGKVRRYFRPGGTSTVYRLGNTEILIKEAEIRNKPQLREALERMDYLHGICLKYLDPFVRVPDHYGIFTPANSNTEYLMMRKINDGVTVRDVLRERVIVGKEIREEVEKDYNSLKPKILDAVALASRYQQIPYRFLLSDWKDENVLVDFTLRSADKPYTLWIIDQ